MLAGEEHKPAAQKISEDAHSSSWGAQLIFLGFWGQWVNFGFLEVSGIFFSDFSLALSVLTTGFEWKAKLG